MISLELARWRRMGCHILIIATPLVSCGGSADDAIQSATGKTPYRYIICDATNTRCFVAARFNDIDSCESHKKKASMLCVTSTDGVLTCRPDTRPLPSDANSYCIP